MQNTISKISGINYGLFLNDTCTVIRNILKVDFTENVKIAQKFLVTVHFLRSKGALMHMDVCKTQFETYLVTFRVNFSRISVQLLEIYQKSILPKMSK